MKLIIFVALVVVATAAPQRVQRQGLFQRGLGTVVQLLRFGFTNDGLGNYNYLYDQNDGQKRQEQGILKNAGAENEAIAVTGSYSWVGPDDVTYNVKYTADENGYRPDIEQGPGGSIPLTIIESITG